MVKANCSLCPTSTPKGWRTNSKGIYIILGPQTGPFKAFKYPGEIVGFIGGFGCHIPSPLLSPAQSTTLPLISPFLNAKHILILTMPNGIWKTHYLAPFQGWTPDPCSTSQSPWNHTNIQLSLVLHRSIYSTHAAIFFLAFALEQLCFYIKWNTFTH